jgi:hypothetical protein
MQYSTSKEPTSRDAADSVAIAALHLSSGVARAATLRGWLLLAPLLFSRDCPGRQEARHMDITGAIVLSDVYSKGDWKKTDVCS